MEYYVHGSSESSTFATLDADPSAPADDWHIQHAVPSPAQRSTDTGLEEGIWQLSMEGRYPERPGEPDCVYYIRTGLCSFGMGCRYHHPPNWRAAAMSRTKVEYPERPEQPECQYYLKTGTCKFGTTCKYHHPRDKAGLGGRVQLNIVGLPLRQGEKECAYYMRTGACKYGVTCKFHHPQPTPVSPLVSVPGSPLYGQPLSPSTSGHYQPWPLRSPYMHSPRLGPSAYTPVIVPQQGVVSMPGWTTYQGAVSPMASPDPYGPNYFLDPQAGMGLPAFPSPRDSSAFPERPGQPECQYYLKTGDCKFGAGCRYHHPKDKAGNFVLSALGLPLRPGAPPCTYYTRNGVCKFGVACKFDHPLGSLAYGPSADVPMTPSYRPTPPFLVELQRDMVVRNLSRQAPAPSSTTTDEPDSTASTASGSIVQSSLANAASASAASS